MLTSLFLFSVALGFANSETTSVATAIEVKATPLSWTYPYFLRRDFGSEKVSGLSSEERQKALKELALVELRELSVSAEDRDTIAEGWIDTKAFLWSGTSFAKKPADLRSLLATAYRIENETRSVIHRQIKIESAPKIENEAQLIGLNILTSTISPYELTKLRREGFDGKVEDFFESVGYAVFEKNSTGQVCSIPIVGQTLEAKKHILVAGLAVNSAVGMMASFDREGRDLTKVLTAQQEGGQEYILTHADSLLSNCVWIDRNSQPEFSVAQNAYNYSVYKYLTITIGTQESAMALVLTTPSARRGLWADCGYSEEKTWVLYRDKREKNRGGRFAITADQNRLRASAVAGAEAQLDVRGGSFTLYLWNNPSNKKTLQFVSGFEGKPDEFLNWLSNEIPKDPY